MPREYHHIQNYEREILELKSQGYTLRAIGEKFGFTYKQMHNFITRYNANQRKQSVGIMPKPNELASKERYIKRLEMENELMRDFLSLTGRK